MGMLPTHASAPRSDTTSERRPSVGRRLFAASPTPRVPLAQECVGLAARVALGPTCFARSDGGPGRAVLARVRDAVVAWVRLKGSKVARSVDVSGGTPCSQLAWWNMDDVVPARMSEWENRDGGMFGWKTGVEIGKSGVRSVMLRFSCNMSWSPDLPTPTAALEH
ncbi:hypothetical protein OPT61_g3699 [Boeremia exigua]|uniref:Uncharacterized protein n=1 Tax=Boeremia exigua TaxID=749465 RepID=A0ACC2IGX1_9PLEO|nr:hypothetical protein OPT61_g3699 [Boeremia exigua]